ncbi:Rieske 2Fe-2S domain-containing protein [Paraburkholderia graminis]|uniref:Rieske 2Fe-2S domain-containing protein n=1 Tax=Paraburkholderia graminis TaxID=60548 RepID=UPI0038B896A8
MRQYWIPAIMSSELERDREPVRLMLLGEKLVAFRDSDGNPGIMDERCPHRGVSLFLGRVEEGGIRCVYHGWKFRTDGTCIDMPSVPTEQACPHLVKARAFPVRECGGVVWIYLGDRSEPPALPQIEAALLPSHEVNVYCLQRECNYLQMAESDLDTSHFGFLHLGCLDADDFPENNPLRFAAENRAPEFASSEMPWGTSYGAHRAADDNQRYWRVANFLFPFWTQSPQGDFNDHIDARAFVPMDDEHTMMFHFSWRGKSRPLVVEDKEGKPLPGLRNNNVLLPNTTDWYGRWRPAANPQNDWLIDREMQRSRVTFSGLDNIRTQDQAAVESMGPIVDHAQEHLVSSDQMVAKTRRRMVKALQRFVEGEAPPGVDDSELFRAARGGFFVADEAIQWPDVYYHKAEGDGMKHVAPDVSISS